MKKSKIKQKYFLLYVHFCYNQLISVYGKQWTVNRLGDMDITFIFIAQNDESASICTDCMLTLS